ncbi:ATP-NAD kinase family protein [Patulibacter sp.]|uniref:ATP-NAD kinase family protein n=1 Tax=Patulibacter sp. TaxID=1912859 RepID=UPI00271B31F2|nr:NAD(+)/NADH kinase [Patulibacter sp.]MDO9407359.1 NAD(+)/NADH kinase [Patulibacter sp.]
MPGPDREQDADRPAPGVAHPASGDGRRPRLGLIVNPVAGVGGRVGLKGSDGAAVQRRALWAGAVPQASVRTIRALRRLAGVTGLEVLAAPGAMGADQAAAVGLSATAIAWSGTVPSSCAPGQGLPPTTAADTRAAARELVRAGVDLLLFAGGDGTACDVHDVVGDRVPVLGIPTGVKMHSGVFASSPEAAGEATAAWLADPSPDRLVDADVADIDEVAVREDRIATRLHGRVRVPRDRARVLAAKGGTARRVDAELDAACARTMDDVAPGTLVLVGPGTTAGRALRGLGLPSTLLGVDAVRDGEDVGRDLDERGLLALLDDAPSAVLLLGVVGGQGALLGRGNQQLSPAVLRRLGPGALRVVAGRDKLAALSPGALRVDTGDAELDRRLSGHLPVRVSARETVVMAVAP